MIYDSRTILENIIVNFPGTLCREAGVSCGFSFFFFREQKPRSRFKVEFYFPKIKSYILISTRETYVRTTRTWTIVNNAHL